MRVRFDEELGLLIGPTEMDKIQVGQEIWETIGLDPRGTISARARQKLYMVERWTNMVKYLLLKRPDLQLTWPVMTETQTEISLKSRIIPNAPQ